MFMTMALAAFGAPIDWNEGARSFFNYTRDMYPPVNILLAGFEPDTKWLKRMTPISVDMPAGQPQRRMAVSSSIFCAKGMFVPARTSPARLSIAFACESCAIAVARRASRLRPLSSRFASGGYTFKEGTSCLTRFISPITANAKRSNEQGFDVVLYTSKDVVGQVREACPSCVLYVMREEHGHGAASLWRFQAANLKQLGGAPARTLAHNNASHHADASIR